MLGGSTGTGTNNGFTLFFIRLSTSWTLCATIDPIALPLDVLPAAAASLDEPEADFSKAGDPAAFGDVAFGEATFGDPGVEPTDEELGDNVAFNPSGILFSRLPRPHSK